MRRAIQYVKVTVITAVLNGEGTIGATLGSVSSQDYAPIEHIVVDGASTDTTLEAVQRAQHSGLRVFSDKDSGVYQAFNRGLREATGDVVVFLNCGDVYCTHTVISTMMNTLAAADVEAVFGDVAVVNSRQPDRMIRRYSSSKFRPSRMRYGLMPAHPTLFLRRKVYEMVGEYDEHYRIAGDFEFCLRAFLAHGIRFRYVPEVLVSMPAGGLSNRGWRSKWEITMEMLRACRNNGVKSNLAMLCARVPLKMMELI